MMAGYVLAQDLGIDAPRNYRFVWTDESSQIERIIVEQAIQNRHPRSWDQPLHMDARCADKQGRPLRFLKSDS